MRTLILVAMIFGLGDRDFGPEPLLEEDVQSLTEGFVKKLKMQ
jgi:hypothetical protein